MKKPALMISIVLLCASLWSASAMAQAYSKAKDTDQFYPEFKTDEDMAVASTNRTPTSSVVQYGGWIMPTFITDYRSDSSQLSTAITTADVWLKAYLWNNAFIYIRVKDTLTGIMLAKGYTKVDELTNLVDLDLGYISTSFLDGLLKLQFGRKFFTAGTGLVLNGRGDGIQFDVASKWVRLSVYGMYSGLIKKENNLYRLSDKDYSDGSKRFFTGGEVAIPFENQELYVLAVAQFDMSSAGARHTYNSQYFGGGLRGLIVDAVSYYGEFIYEIGSSFDTDNKKNSIRAMAASFGLDYFINVTTFPTISVQYNYASGDNSRIDYSSSTSGPDSGYDTGFMGFGTYNAGYALRPLPGNLHVVRAGFSISPFSWANQVCVKRITLAAKYSYYMKDKTKGQFNDGNENITDTSSTKPIDALEVGHGVDVSLRWTILSDLTLFVNYGFFKPGDAYVSSENDRHFVMEGIGLSF